MREPGQRNGVHAVQNVHTRGLKGEGRVTRKLCPCGPLFVRGFKFGYGQVRRQVIAKGAAIRWTLWKMLIDGAEKPLNGLRVARRHINHAGECRVAGQRHVERSNTRTDWFKLVAGIV